MLLRCLAASAPPEATGSVTPASALSGSAAASQSSTEGPLSTSAPGTVPWILDSGASFHMTHLSLPLFIPQMDHPLLLQDEALFCLALFVFLLFLMFPN
uniref:Uncharacterized protein n=1 Tax=Arundo donax TaxID=35708 RepID=A0A0A9H7Y6_ARUDO